MDSNPAPDIIAQVIADIRAGRILHPHTHHQNNHTDRNQLRAGRIPRPPATSPETKINARCLQWAQQPQPVIDCTAVFNSMSRTKGVALYDDHPEITPPWPDAFFCFLTKAGNAMCMQVHTTTWDGTQPPNPMWLTDNDVNWATVRWVATTTIWVGGGRNGATPGQPLPTCGPMHLFRHAINADGSPADINWVALTARKSGHANDGNPVDPNQDSWDAALCTLGQSLSFLNCSNIETAEPARPRPQRRRLERAGVTVQTIVVRPPGKRSLATAGTTARPMDSLDTPISPVRGHTARYGPQYDRGLLFGKHAGKFWIPGHVRGARGTTETPVKDYILKPTVPQPAPEGPP